ncbi:hypothetical protein IMCC3317_15730 [Kordia antarctica]|uniref:Uncharacterized protein n=1 Tax=Kordia antarctica TaxID=1218801 RepID=A0A7L4ZJY3_9FLAO|nr:hypothetical protein [Kordia antarctica]QHI36214.1 hypothetical protein IMCC3317_15730 [Kordia antarctica]
MGQKKIPITDERTQFLETYGDLKDGKIQRELLFVQTLQLDKLEKIRSNTSKLVWWLVVIPTLLFILAIIFGGFR